MEDTWNKTGSAASGLTIIVCCKLSNVSLTMLQLYATFLGVFF